MSAVSHKPGEVVDDEYNRKKRVSYFYDNDIGSFYYGSDHPMKPFRIKMAHQLIVNYGLYR